VSAAALSTDGSLVATAGADGTAKLWSTDGGALLDTLTHPGVDAVAFSPDGTLLATGGSDRLARIWRTSDGGQVGAAGHPVTVSKLAFSPDGHFLASAAGNIAYVWSVPDWKQHFSVTHTNTVTSIAWSRDGGRLLTASVDSTAQLLSVRTGHILQRYHGHVSTISQAALSADGRWVATAGPTTAGMWPTTFDPLLPDDRLFFLRGSGAQVLSVAFSPSGWRLATGDRDGAVRFYDCELCGGVAQLVPLAKQRLAALGPTR
jgi:WD40 repeat protein